MVMRCAEVSLTRAVERQLVELHKAGKVSFVNVVTFKCVCGVEWSAAEWLSCFSCRCCCSSSSLLCCLVVAA